MASTGVFKIHYWPGLVFGLYLVTIIVSYSIAVSNGHVYSLFPYISDTGTIPPESCIFGQLFNILSVILGITLYIRYRQVEFDISSGDANVGKKWNTLSLWLASCLCIGVTTVANFQETAILEVHMLGAVLAFAPGTVYFLVQTRITFSSRCKTNAENPTYIISKNMLYFRVFISFALVPLFAINGICGILSLAQFQGKTMNWWTEKEGAFQLRLASTFTEWIFVTFMFIYILTFTNDFKLLEFKGIKFRNKKDNMKNERQEMI